mmetsp:Transcript_26486/g.43834  ORF Transcript_26486/g.43834 Transcript_26486/m.43834 type:complete len:269 (+) Transcript_26486:163-969(+)
MKTTTTALIPPGGGPSSSSVKNTESPPCRVSMFIVMSERAGRGEEINECTVCHTAKKCPTTFPQQPTSSCRMQLQLSLIFLQQGALLEPPRLGGLLLPLRLALELEADLALLLDAHVDVVHAAQVAVVRGGEVVRGGLRDGVDEDVPGEEPRAVDVGVLQQVQPQVRGAVGDQDVRAVRLEHAVNLLQHFPSLVPALVPTEHAVHAPLIKHNVKCVVRKAELCSIHIIPGHVWKIVSILLFHLFNDHFGVINICYPVIPFQSHLSTHF